MQLWISSKFIERDQTQIFSEKKLGNSHLYFCITVGTFFYGWRLFWFFIFVRCTFSNPYNILFSKNFQLNYINKYPFFTELPTSSKQSRKIKVLINSVECENLLKSDESHEQGEYLLMH